MILSIKIKSSIKKGLIEDQNANTINYSRPKTAKIDTLVLTKEAIKPYSLGPTISTYLISGSSPPPPPETFIHYKPHLHPRYDHTDHLLPMFLDESSHEAQPPLRGKQHHPTR